MACCRRISSWSSIAVWPALPHRHGALARRPAGGVHRHAGHVTQLYVRGLDRAEATPIPGTEGASGPFFSPDGAWIGFWADNKIKKVPVAGGPPATICDVPAGGGWGASWGEDGTIFFAEPSRASPRCLRPAERQPRSPRPMPSRASVICCRNALPGGKALLFTVMTARRLGDGERRSAVARHRRAARPHSRRRRRPLRQHGAPCVHEDRHADGRAVRRRSRQVTGAPWP